MFTGLGKLPSHFNPDLKNSLNFHVDSRFTYNPNLHVDSLHQQPQSPEIPYGIREILPAGSCTSLAPLQFLSSSSALHMRTLCRSLDGLQRLTPVPRMFLLALKNNQSWDLVCFLSSSQVESSSSHFKSS